MAKVKKKASKVSAGTSSSKKSSKAKVKTKSTGLRKAANINGKSYSQIAREILTKTGDRAKASKKLREVGCSSASAVVAKVAQRMEIPPQKKSKSKVTVKKGKSTVGKGKAKKSKKKRAPEPEEEFEEEDELFEDEEDEEFEEEEDEEF